MRIYFGGTFDPVHLGHVQLAEELAAYFNLNKVFLMPCYTAVHKDQVKATPEQRLAMLTLAIEGHSNLFIDTRELQQTVPSYTYNSLSAIREEIDNESLAFVIGTDSMISFPQWYQSDRMSELTNLIVIQRPETSFEQTSSDTPGQSAFYRDCMDKVLSLGFEETKEPALVKSNKSGLLISLKLSQLDVSSTEVRRLVNQNKPINHLVGDKVADYIKQTNLYLNKEA